MYYILYLASLCRRRSWAEPSYEAYATTSGYTCVVRVNNREYQTDMVCESETLAREGAAMRAYLICRNFSVNDGMYPAGHSQGGAVQGIPVAIGTGRKSSRDDESDTSVSSSGGSWSGGSSPERMMRMDQVGRGEVGVAAVPGSARALAYARRDV
ncbi:hypothetical protein N7468_010000 [Penicillium chermesinum]|uniref:DRBM domain-containing protein n=1 Tax=Penicillium chermesinum TaxID=63820 RepID=A0A9W9TBU4_9EURO|nr:uncharacterized protein N7468_010000 [Penicillium chermesinum]KAJ5216992.1 hypothetical protein N7468_010000 [Penicillium chermesinum]